MLERRQRIMESALGPFSEWSSPALGRSSSSHSPTPTFAPLLYKFTVLNYLVIFENLIPLLELDGYFILAETIEVPDLRERSLQFIQHDVWHKLRARDRFSKQEVGLGAYAVIGVAFTVLSVWGGDFLLEGDLRNPRVGAVDEGWISAVAVGARPVRHGSRDPRFDHPCQNRDQAAPLALAED